MARAFRSPARTRSAISDRSSCHSAQNCENHPARWRSRVERFRQAHKLDSEGNPVADEILRALRDNPSGLTRTQINELFVRNRKASEIARALSVLLQHGFAGFQTETTGGRNVERWFAKGRVKAA